MPLQMVTPRWLGSIHIINISQQLEREEAPEVGATVRSSELCNKMGFVSAGLKPLHCKLKRKRINHRWGTNGPFRCFWESCQASFPKGSLYHSCALYVKSSDPRAQSNPWVRAQKRAGVTSTAFIYCKWRNGSCLWQGNISEGSRG